MLISENQLRDMIREELNSRDPLYGEVQDKINYYRNDDLGQIEWKKFTKIDIEDIIAGNGDSDVMMAYPNWEKEHFEALLSGVNG